MLTPGSAAPATDGTVAQPSTEAPEAVPAKVAPPASPPKPARPQVTPARAAAGDQEQRTEAATAGPREKAEAAPVKATPPPPETRPVPAEAANRTEPWAKIVADPGHTPELLALAAVQTLGPRAYDWVLRVREAYPTASSAGIARLAARQFGRFGGVSTLFAAVAGSYAPLALIGSVALTNAELVLHIAAAYDLDPRHRERATDLLVLTGVHPTREEARAALHSAEQPVYEDEDGGIVDAAWRLGRMAAAQAAGWAAVRAVNHFFPGSGLIAATLVGRSAARTVAARATAFYRAAADEGAPTGG